MKPVWPISILLCFRCFAPTPLFFGLNGPLVTSSSTGFDPTIYGVTTEGWWAPRKESGFANNDPIGSLTDYSGNSRTATQGTSTAKPTYKTGISGVSLPVGYYDLGDLLATASFSISQPFTIALVAQSTTSAVNNTGCGSVGGFVGLSARTDSKWLVYAGSIPATVGSTSGWSVLVVVFNGASSFIYSNGTKTTLNPGAGGISSGFSIGAWSSGSERFLGYIGETVLWSGAMTDGNASAACASLQTQWGL